MEILQLKYFQTVAYTEHISLAAKQLNIAQPSLSLTIKRLEDELGTTLFDRKGRNIQLNESGKILLKHVNNLFIEIENAQTEINMNKHELLNTIKIAVSNPRFLSGLLSAFICQNPHTKIQQVLGGRNTIRAGLQKGDINLGIACPPLEEEDIESITLVEEDIVLVLPSNHRLVHASEIKLSDLSNDSFISLANNKEYKLFTANLCKKAGFTPNILFEVDFNILLEIIMLNQGVALLPVWVCRKCKLQYKRISDMAPTYTIGLSWMKNKHLSPSVESFRTFIIDYFKKNEHMFKH
ncbi:LysR family transcriptional regulator [Cytobacillus sp. Sa5YUA1]|uniref:LysR family transcriptional regulator n=1 Tax=Cytobacillus stercorigallinarum TaxID=2762240 RepID=A0ABR8QVV0_9BACI|nr:LysR family transcriptional regulator [Cytobacillus stercorigallinarum]MBD7939663.1 LysR family transcriptional regulator [Cytobacillus stercorigallinarum]